MKLRKMKLAMINGFFLLNFKPPAPISFFLSFSFFIKLVSNFAESFLNEIIRGAYLTTSFYFIQNRFFQFIIPHLLEKKYENLILKRRSQKESNLYIKITFHLIINKIVHISNKNVEVLQYKVPKCLINLPHLYKQDTLINNFGKRSLTYMVN